MCRGKDLERGEFKLNLGCGFGGGEFNTVMVEKKDVSVARIFSTGLLTALAQLLGVVFGVVVVVGIDLILHVVAVEVDPEEEHIPVECLDVAGGQDWSRLLRTALIAKMQMDG